MGRADDRNNKSASSQQGELTEEVKERLLIIMEELDKWKNNMAEKQKTLEQEELFLAEEKAQITEKIEDFIEESTIFTKQQIAFEEEQEYFISKQEELEAEQAYFKEREEIFAQDLRCFEEDKEFFDKQRRRFKKEQEQLEIEMREFAKEKEVNDRLTEGERNRLKQMEQLFEAKWKILEEEIVALTEERRRFELEKEFHARVSSYNAGEHVGSDVDIFFSGIDNELALRKRYKDLLKIFHPDNLYGDGTIVKEINRQYAELKERFCS